MGRLERRCCSQLTASVVLFSLFLTYISYSRFDNELGPFLRQDSNAPLIDVKVPGPESFCPPFQKGAGFAERINFVDGTGEKCLLLRSVCGIESTARTNPDMQILVYTHSTKDNLRPLVANSPRPGRVRHCRVMDVLKELPNVQIIRQDLEKEFLSEKRWDPVFDDPGKWTDLHLTDATKLQLTKLYGGLTLDSDIITFRPVHCIANSLVSLTSVGRIGSELLSFERDNPFVSYLIRSAVFHFDEGDRWSLGGPAFTEAFKEFCLTENLTAGARSCHRGSSINLMDESSIYPLEPYQWINYFLHSFDQSQVKAFDGSFLAHIHSSEWGVQVPATSLYSSLARFYCPATWEAARRAHLTEYF